MNTGRAVLGITFVSLGGLLLLDQADVLDAGAIIADWWPVMLLVLAALELLARPARRITAAVFAVLGVVLLTATTGLLAASAWALVWPTLIILLGLWLLLRAGRGSGIEGTATHDGDFDVTGVFSGRKVASTANPLRHGNATAVFVPPWRWWPCSAVWTSGCRRAGAWNWTARPSSAGWRTRRRRRPTLPPRPCASPRPRSSVVWRSGPPR